MHIKYNPHLAKIPTKTLQRIARKDEDAGNELLRRKLGFLCAMEIRSLQQRQEAEKMSRWLKKGQ